MHYKHLQGKEIAHLKVLADILGTEPLRLL